MKVIKTKGRIVIPLLILTITLCLLINKVYSYVTLTEKSAGDNLPAVTYNENLSLLNAGLDSVLADIRDSSFAHLDDIRDTASAMLQDSLFAHLDEIGDTVNVRLPTNIYLNWTDAFADSVAANDSLTIEISIDTAIGNTQCLYIQNDEGVVETVTLYLDYMLLNPIAILDSIEIDLYTETTDGTDYVAFSVWDDSTDVSWELKFEDVADDSVSSTARTTRTVCIDAPNITGGRFRLKGIINTENDTTIVGVPKLYITNP